MKTTTITSTLLITSMLLSCVTSKQASAESSQGPKHTDHDLSVHKATGKGQNGCIPNKWVNFDNESIPTFNVRDMNGANYIQFEGATIHILDDEGDIIDTEDVDRIFFKADEKTVQLWNTAIKGANPRLIEIGLCQSPTTESVYFGPIYLGERRYFSVGAVFIDNEQKEPLSPPCRRQ